MPLNDTKFSIFIYFKYLRYLSINTRVDTFSVSYVRKNMFNFLNSESKEKDATSNTLHRFLCIYRKFKGAKRTEYA